MKKIFLSFFLLILCLSLHAQQISGVKKDTIQLEIDLKLIEAGKLLEKGSGQIIAGAIIGTLGAIMIATANRPGIIIGGGICVVGLGFSFNGTGKIGSAGRKLYSK